MTNQEYEAEIARLTQGYEDLKFYIENNKYPEEQYQGGLGNYVVISEDIIDEINKITGGEK